MVWGAVIVLAFGAAFCILLNGSAGRRRDWAREDREQEKALEQLKKGKGRRDER